MSRIDSARNAALSALVLSTALGVAAFAAPAPARAPSATAAQDKEEDTVYLKGGKTQGGRIQSEDYSGLTFDGRGSNAKTLTWGEVVSIEYADAAVLGEALSTLGAGRLDEALAQLGDIQGEEKLRPVVQQQVLFHIALIHQKSGRLDEAVAAWRALLEAFPKGRYLRVAGENLVGCLLAKGDEAGASSAADELAANAKDVAGFDGEVALIKGRLLEAKKSFPEALALYAEAEKSAAPAVQLEAQVARARCLALQGKSAEAEPICRKITLDEKAPRHVLAGAWNGIGDAWAEEGRAKKDAEKLLEALFAYMRGVVQYAPLSGEPTSEHERALAGSARCFRFISQLEQNPERKRLYEERARARLEQLSRDFPASLYLEESRSTPSPAAPDSPSKKPR